MKPEKRVINYNGRVDIYYVIKDATFHREDGPAITTLWDDGDFLERWMYEDKTHRFNGPAIITSAGSREYYVHGKKVTHEVQEWLRDMKYSWPTMAGTQKFELELFLRSLC